ncbi:MAG: hypothetical protein HZA50_07625 [Planctomycetes bacterium]|nr:hypothetical protein [Planctomycetota bacterium]
MLANRCEHGRRFYGGSFAQPHTTAGGYLLFGAPSGSREAKDAWTVKAPDGVWMKAVLLAGDAVFFAMHPNLGDPAKGELWITGASDGKDLGKIIVSGAPRFDGLAASEGRLFVSTQNGKVICLGKD